MFFKENYIHFMRKKIILIKTLSNNLIYIKLLSNFSIIIFKYFMKPMYIIENDKIN